MRILAPLLALVLAAGSAWLRYEAATSHPAFDPTAPESVLRSDPALLYYLTHEAERAGGFPESWSAEPQLAWPETVSVLREYTVGQELLVAWTRPWLAPKVPLHVYCVALFAVVAALTTLAVYGLGAELGRSRGVGLFAALVFVLLPGAYRTLGFVLIREDLSLPLFATHLALGLRALRTNGRGAWLLTGLSLAAALATWHAAGLLLALELGLLFAWALVSGSRPLASSRAALALVPLVVAVVLVPALRAKGALFAPGLAFAVALVLTPRLARTQRGQRRLLAGIAGGWLAAGMLVSPAGRDLSHVLSLVLSKFEYAGVLPDDPSLLSFETRMMWQGPFGTLGLTGLFDFLLLAGFACPLVLWFGARSAAGPERYFAALLLAGLVLAVLLQRLIVVPAIVLPPLIALAAQRARALPAGPIGGLGVASVLFFQALLFSHWIHSPPLPWYSQARARETQLLVQAVRNRVPPGDAILSDFMLSPVLLATTGNPMVVQPKWETAAARERVEELWQALYHGSLDDLAQLAHRYQTHWFVVDRAMLGVQRASAYLAGMPAGVELEAGSAVALLVANEPAELVNHPAAELVWSSPPSPTGAPGLYRIVRFARD